MSSTSPVFTFGTNNTSNSNNISNHNNYIFGTTQNTQHSNSTFSFDTSSNNNTQQNILEKTDEILYYDPERHRIQRYFPYNHEDRKNELNEERTETCTQFDVDTDADSANNVASTVINENGIDQERMAAFRAMFAEQTIVFIE